MEKKKKGKRKSETTVESLELDQGLPSASLRSPEESAESADSQVPLRPGAPVEAAAARWGLADADPVAPLSPSQVDLACAPLSPSQVDIACAQTWAGLSRFWWVSTKRPQAFSLAS